MLIRSNFRSKLIGANPLMDQIAIRYQKVKKAQERVKKMEILKQIVRLRKSNRHIMIPCHLVKPISKSYVEQQLLTGCFSARTQTALSNSRTPETSRLICGRILMIGLSPALLKAVASLSLLRVICKRIYLFIRVRSPTVATFAVSPMHAQAALRFTRERIREKSRSNVKFAEHASLRTVILKLTCEFIRVKSRSDANSKAVAKALRLKVT